MSLYIVPNKINGPITHVLATWLGWNSWNQNKHAFPDTISSWSHLHSGNHSLHGKNSTRHHEHRCWHLKKIQKVVTSYMQTKQISVKGKKKKIELHRMVQGETCPSKWWKESTYPHTNRSTKLTNTLLTILWARIEELQSISQPTDSTTS